MMTPARGMTISLGKGIRQLSSDIASTIPASPVVAYKCRITVVIAVVIFCNKKASFAFQHCDYSNTVRQEEAIVLVLLIALLLLHNEVCAKSGAQLARLNAGQIPVASGHLRTCRAHDVPLDSSAFQILALNCHAAPQYGDCEQFDLSVVAGA